MFPAVNHQQGDMRFFMHRLPDEVEAFASGRTYGFAGKRKYGVSPPMLEKYRKAMSGRGWLSAKDIYTTMGMTREAVGSALSNALYPQGYVEQRRVSARRNEYRWKDSPQPN